MVPHRISNVFGAQYISFLYIYEFSAHWHVEEEQQFLGIRQYRVLQCQQQHDESRGVKRRANGLPGAEPDVDLAGCASETDQAEESDREGEDERRLAGLLSVDHGAGYPRIRHAQAKVQVLFLLRPESEDRRGAD